MILPDERGAEAGAEAEKQHASAAVITAERLQRGVVNDPHRFPERLREIESGPAVAEMFRILHDFPSRTGAGNPIETASKFQSRLLF